MQTPSANGTERPTDWNSINWNQANRNVRNLRQRIFRASKEGDHKKARSLQKLLLRSRSNALVSVRKVTQTNSGKNTPGVDRLIVKTPAARGTLVDELSTYTHWQAKPAKRVYIPKANGKLRPLGIPVVKDRCLQAMVKNALEPYWEARFEGISYGFRPGRGCHDAISQIFNLAQAGRKKPWVVDADIKGAFDNIDHEFLLQTIGPAPGRELIRQWLRAGYVDKEEFHPTEAGTPQGGVVSPLLANIALHGMEEALTVYRVDPKTGEKIATHEGVRYDNRGRNTGARAVVRYADDFAVFCETREDATQVVEILTKWLKERGLELSAEKTKIVHLEEGFDFLGFTVRRYKCPKTTRTGVKLLITPSKKSVQKLRDRLKQEWIALRGHSLERVIATLNPIIRGWANYFRSEVAQKTFEDLDRWMFQQEHLWAKFSHPNKPWHWRKARYWGALNPKRKDQWVFGDKRTGKYLLKFSWFPIERHIRVRGRSSPDDPELQAYWARRNEAKAKATLPNKGLVARQKGLCPRCKASLANGEDVQTHHRQQKGQGGTNDPSNLELVHLYCHQQIHADGKLCGEHPKGVAREDRGE